MIGFLLIGVALPLAIATVVLMLDIYRQQDEAYRDYVVSGVFGLIAGIVASICLVGAIFTAYERGVAERRCEVLAEQNPEANPTWNDYGFFSYECRYTERQTDTPNWLVFD